MDGITCWSDVVVCGCFEDVAPLIPDECISLVFTSPPYGVGMEYEPDGRFALLLQTLNHCFGEVGRVLKRGGYAVFNFGDLIPARQVLGTTEPCQMPMGWIYWAFGLANGLSLQAQRVWQKDFARITGGKQAISAPRPVTEIEHLYTFRRPGGGPQVVKARQISQRAIWSTVGAKTSPRKKHPAAFPAELVRMVLEVYSDPGDLVLDPYAGGGTVGVVCREMGRRYLLVEKEPQYCDLIKQALAAGEG
jgi:DNA modification methylase